MVSIFFFIEAAAWPAILTLLLARIFYYFLDFSKRFLTCVIFLSDLSFYSAASYFAARIFLSAAAFAA
jgi:hypothetical protein